MADNLLKTVLNLLANPMLLAGVGGFAGYQYFGKGKPGKTPYIAAGAGALAGYLAGRGAQSFLAPAATVAATATLPATTTAKPKLNLSVAEDGMSVVTKNGTSVRTPLRGDTRPPSTQTGMPSATETTPTSSSAPIGTKEETPIGEKSVGEILDSFGSFEDGEYGSLSPDRGWSEDEALGNLAEVDTDVVSLSSQVRRGNGHSRA